ncbi:glycosyltransferase [Amylibacter sp.]|nr:glycosyltransferase [Amylibacter sp.]
MDVIDQKISVLLAVKNGEKFISEAIESVLSQTYRNFELIIIVNCSKDKTLSIVNSFKDKDDRVVVLVSDICQLNFNLNLGLSHASGEFIARIDADDICVPNRFEKQIIKLQLFDIVGSNLDIIDNETVLDSSVNFPQYNIAIRKKIFYRTVIAHPSVMMRKKVLLDVGGYQGGEYAQDYDLWIRLMRNQSILFHNIQENLTQYRVHSNQSKGDSVSYSHVAGYLFREAIISKSLRYFIGSFVFIGKYFFK